MGSLIKAAFMISACYFFVGYPLFLINALRRLGRLCLRNSSGFTMWRPARMIFSIVSTLYSFIWRFLLLHVRWSLIEAIFIVLAFTNALFTKNCATDINYWQTSTPKVSKTEINSAVFNRIYNCWCSRRWVRR